MNRIKYLILITIPILIIAVILIIYFSTKHKDQFLSTFAGTGKAGYSDGLLSHAEFNRPSGLSFDLDGSILIADTYNNSIRRIKNDEVSTVAGYPNDYDSLGFPIGGYVDGDLSTALFNKPRDLVCDSIGRIYVADTGNNAIRIIYKNEVRTLAGCGESGYLDGAKDVAMFNKPTGICIDASGTIYIADSLNHVIRSINSKGEVTTFAGKRSMNGGYKDGSILEAEFNEPCSITIDNDGSLYVLDSGNQLIRKISNNQVSTYSGFKKQLAAGTTYAQGGFKNGESFSAEYNFPKGISFSPCGLILIADTWNNRIRSITKDNKVITLSGNGIEGKSDGYISKSQLNKPMGVINYNGFIYIADTMNHSIRILPYTSEK